MKSRPIIVGDWTIDPLSGEMTGASGSTHLEPKVVQVLMYLVENAGEVATRDEILASVWGSRSAVSDEPLTRCITVLRHAFGDSAARPQYIRTVPKVGYMLIAPVVEAGDAAEHSDPVPAGGQAMPVAADRTGRPRYLTQRNLLLATVAVLVVVIGRSFFEAPLDTSANSGDPPARTSIAVLPFKTGGAGGPDDYLGAGFAAEVRLLLGRLRELRVAAGQSSAVLAGTGADLKAIARGLGVEYILDGTVQRDGRYIQVYVQLNSGADGFQLWSEKYRFVFESSGIFEIQTRIANSAVDALVDTLALPGKVPRFDVVTPTDSIQAYDLYLRGKQFLNLRSLDSAIEMFQSAIDADPGYGMPYVALAYAISLGPSRLAVADTGASFERSRDILRTARDRDPTVADAALGIEAFLDLREGRLASAYSAYRRSLEIFPSEPILHHGLSLLMSTVGRHEEALQHANIARDLDRQSPIANGRLAVANLWLGRDEEAAAWFNQSLDLGLDTAQNLQAYLLLLFRQERYEEARALGHRLREKLGAAMPWWDDFVDAREGRASTEAAIDSLTAAAGAVDAVPLMQLGAWAILGDEDRALDILAGIFEGNPTTIGGFVFSSELAELRRHPRFGEILAASPISDFWAQYGGSPLCRKSAGGAIDCG